MRYINILSFCAIGTYRSTIYSLIVNNIFYSSVAYCEVNVHTNLQLKLGCIESENIIAMPFDWMVCLWGCMFRWDELPMRMAVMGCLCEPDDNGWQEFLLLKCVRVCAVYVYTIHIHMKTTWGFVVVLDRRVESGVRSLILRSFVENCRKFETVLWKFVKRFWFSSTWCLILCNGVSDAVHNVCGSLRSAIWATIHCDSGGGYRGCTGWNWDDDMMRWWVSFYFSRVYAYAVYCVGCNGRSRGGKCWVEFWKFCGCCCSALLFIIFWSLFICLVSFSGLVYF